MTDLYPAALGRLVRATAVLALPARDQLDWLASLGLPGGPAHVDELALDFGDAALLRPQFVELGWLSEPVSALIDDLDAFLEELSSPAHSALWRPYAVETADEWTQIRSKARAILFAV